MLSAEAAIDRLCDPAAAVSSHYVIDEGGTLWNLVPEEVRAYHAGISYWRGHTALNNRSIGIEIVNPGHEHGYRPFPAPQMQSVLTLCQAIQSRHPIDPRNIVAHSDIAPNRKQDPGELFPWQWLATHGVGLWPQPADPADPADLPALLHRIGYPDMQQSILAFQRRYHPATLTGAATPQTTAIASALERLFTQRPPAHHASTPPISSP